MGAARSDRHGSIEGPRYARKEYAEKAEKRITKYDETNSSVTFLSTPNIHRDQSKTCALKVTTWLPALTLR
jgi:hypothetical protein